MVALYDEARFGGSPAPLPPIDIIDMLRRSEAGARDAALLRAKLFDHAYTAGPLPKDMTEAARWYRKAAEAGDAEAALALGRMLRDGDGIESNSAEAARWLKVAADAGSAEAQYNLAQLYRDGSGVPADQAEAIRLFRLAAESQSGEAIAQLRALKAWGAQ
jgi:TPR repeat protein